MPVKKQIFAALLLAFSLITTLSACSAKKIDPYTMDEKEAIVWLKQNNISVPSELNGPELGKFVVEIVQGHKAGRDMSLPISYEVTVKFVQEIQHHLE